MSNKSISVSYSSGSRFKSCPEKYYKSKLYKTKLVPSALPFGKAVEEGIAVLLIGESLESALHNFESNWTQEHVRGQEYRQIFDNLDVEFYASDYDKNLIFGESDKQVEEWATELLGESKEYWQDRFETLVTESKQRNLTEVEQVFYNRVVWLCCLIRGKTMIEAFYHKELSKLKLISFEDRPAAQVPISIKNEEGDEVNGFIDFIVTHKDYGDTPIILDLKTAAYPYPAHALDTSEQLRTYVAALGAKINSARAGYLVLIKKIKVEKSCDKCGAKREGLAKNCKACGKGQYTIPKLDADIQFVTKEYDTVELEDVLEDYMNVTVAIKNEVRFKNPSNCNQYGRKCEFYEMCWGRKKIEDLDHLEQKEVLTEEPTTDSVE
jgi:hypothetical protein